MEIIDERSTTEADQEICTLPVGTSIRLTRGLAILVKRAEESRKEKDSI